MRAKDAAVVQRGVIFIFLIHHWEFKQCVSDTLPFVESNSAVSTLFGFLLLFSFFNFLEAF